MTQKSHNSKHLPKIKSYKKDLAPICFYFDLFTTPNFQIPIMPLPMRVDKVSNGESTYLILPNFEQLSELCDELNLQVNFKLFYLIGIKNLISYTKQKYKEVTSRKLRRDLIFNWFENSINLHTEIPSLVEDLTYLLSEFLLMYSFIKIEGNLEDFEEYKNFLIKFCDNIIIYFKDRLNQNLIKINENGNLIEEEIYKSKKQKYYPNIIPINVIKRNKMVKMGFIPYLIYDDIIDVFYYNKKILDLNEQELYGLNHWENIGIINNKSNINNKNNIMLYNNINNLNIKRY